MLSFGKIYDDFVIYFLQIDFYHISAIGAAIFLIYSITSTRLQKILTWKPFLFLGKISYSIYLTHWIFIIVIINNWVTWQNTIFYYHQGNIMYFTLLFLVLALTFIASVVLYYCVEQPMIKAGRKLIAYLHR